MWKALVWSHHFA